MLHHLVILVIPCMAIILAPLIVFVLLAQFYRLSPWQAVLYMVKQLVYDGMRKELHPELIDGQPMQRPKLTERQLKKKRRNKKHKRA